jgi:diguanylate cyclase (GGDEF)-like protein
MAAARARTRATRPVLPDPANERADRSEPEVAAARVGLSFRNKIVALLVLLVVVVQIATFMVVQLATERAVRLQVESDLDVGSRVWERFHQARSRQLLDSVSVLADDFGFRDAVASGDVPTMESALRNHAARIGTDTALLLTPQGRLLASVPPSPPGETEAALGPLLMQARSGGSAYAVVLRAGKPYQMAMVPVLAPKQIAWAVIGVAFDDALASDYRAITALDATFIHGVEAGQVRIAATTLEPRARSVLQSQPAGFWLGARSASVPIVVGDQPHFVRAVAVSADPAHPVLVVLQSSLDSAMAPFDALKRRVLELSAIATLLALAVAWFVARSVSRPVAELAGAAGRIEHGDYSRAVAVRGHDELARLAGVFNRMQGGIAQREQQIVHQGNHDGMTSLPNRTMALSELDAAIARARQSGQGCSVLILDVDHFKEINDTLGHGFGDQVLVEAAKRLRAAARPEDLVARLGGDEFMVLMEGVSVDQAEARARELSRLLREPLRLPSTMINLEASVGIAVFPVHGDEAQTLLRRADIAMYEAKKERAGVAVYASGSDELHLRQLSLMADLRRSIERGELSVVFQPKLEIRSQRVVHAEALTRWVHPHHGRVPPDEFIPLAERSGYIHEISRFVLESALRQCGAWHAEGMPLGIAVNLSAMDLMDASLPAFVHSCLARHGVPASCLILEVTESAIMRDVNHAIRTLQRLRDLGVRIAIDDFGTGHSSLAQLKQLPVDELKIDKSFVLGLKAGSDDAVIVRATIELGHNMGLSVIAEGVEDADSLALLRDYRCDLAQGYLFSPPLSSAAFVAWCREHERVADAAGPAR